VGDFIGNKKDCTGEHSRKKRQAVSGKEGKEGRQTTTRSFLAAKLCRGPGEILSRTRGRRGGGSIRRLV